MGWGSSEEEGDIHYKNCPFPVGTVTTLIAAGQRSIHPNGTKYKSHPVPKISSGSAREMIRKQTVIDKLQLGHDTKDSPPKSSCNPPGSQDLTGTSTAHPHSC